MRPSKEPLLVGIAGPTCSGKSTLERGLKNLYGHTLTQLPFDGLCYNYSDLGYIPSDWEQPELYRFNDYVRYLQELKLGRRVLATLYCAEDNSRCEIDPNELVLSVGFLAFYDYRAVDLFDIKLYLDVPEEVIEERRVERDARSIGGDETSMRRYVNEKIIPANQKYVVPQKKLADEVLDGTMAPEELLQLAANTISQRL